jgi:hypothetical protein
MGGDILTIGAIDSAGSYTAPTSVPNPPTVMVTAVLQSDSTKSGSASITIMPLSSIQGPLTISPALASVTTSQTQQLRVTTTGVANGMVTWAADGGAITAGGLYTPPSAAGPHLITATLIGNSKVLGSATVEVTDIAGNFTWRNDNSRSGQNQKELALSPATVSSATFGKLFSCTVDGYVYAQPLYVANLAIPGSGTRNVVFVATEKDSVYAFDADANANPCVPIWQTSLVPTGEEPVATPNLQITNANVGPFVGITGTPAIDPISSTLFVVAKTQQSGALNPIYHHRLFALDLARGQSRIQPSGVEISTPASVSPAFSPLVQLQRAALLLDHGNVYIAFGSHFDQDEYRGWIIGYDGASLQQLSFLDVAPGSGAKGGIWQSGGGPAADANHLFAITGNGTFDVNRGGPNYGDSFLQLSPTGDAVTDYFTPCDQDVLANADQDVGSSAPVLLPNSIGPASNPNLVLGAAKNGSLYLVDRDTLGGYNSGICPDNPPRPVQRVPVGDGPILSTPLFWNNTVYVAAGNGALKAFPMTAGILATLPASKQSRETFGGQGATPVVSSNGPNNAIIWLIDSSGALATPNTPAILRAYDASDLSKEIYSSSMALADRDKAGPAVKFTVPTVANGNVYIGTQTELDVYGFLGK